MATRTRTTCRRAVRAILGAGLVLLGQAAMPAMAQAGVTAAAVEGEASFDCAKAASGVETIICGDEAVAARDRALSMVYRRALGTSDGPRIRIEQRAWIEKQRDACADAACLITAYDIRLDDLLGPLGPTTDLLPDYKREGGAGDMQLLAVGDGWVVFSILATGGEGPAPNVGSDTGVAKIVKGRGAYQDSEGCRIALSQLNPSTWEVKQGDGCQEGAEVTLSGTYRR